MKLKTTAQFSVDGRHSRWLRKAVGLPQAIKELDAESTARVASISLSQLRKKLHLPVLRYVNMANGQAFLCGGALTSWIGGLPISDYDFFFPDLEAANVFHARLVGASGAELYGYQGTPEYKPTFEQIKAGTLRVADINPQDILDENVRALNYVIKRDGGRDLVQIVLVIRGETPREVIETFDFTISMLGTNGSDVFFGPYTWTDLFRKRLRVNRIHHGISTMRRMVKYAMRGFYACTGTMREISQGVIDSPSDQPISLD